MTDRTTPHATCSESLSKALLKAGKVLGLNQGQLGRIVGRDLSSQAPELDPDSKAGELALMLIRCHQGLFVLMGGETRTMQHWMSTYNHHTRGIPAEQVQTITGLGYVLDYLETMCGKA